MMQSFEADATKALFALSVKISNVTLKMNANANDKHNMYIPQVKKKPKKL